MKYCKECKKEFDDRENVCPICGSQLTEIEASHNGAVTEYEVMKLVASMMITGII